MSKIFFRYVDLVDINNHISLYDLFLFLLAHQILIWLLLLLLCNQGNIWYLLGFYAISNSVSIL